MSRILYIHVGPRKTATTAIQNFLQQHDNSVVLYPKTGAEGRGAHHRLVYECFGRVMKKKNSGRPMFDELLKQIEHEAKNSDRNIVVSSEALELGWSDVGEFANRLLPHLDCTPSDVEILLACREHFSRAASWYNDRTRSFGPNAKPSLPDEFLAECGQRVCYRSLLTRLRNTGLKVTALNYHPSETWTDRFFRHVGFPDDQLPKIGRKHVAVSPAILIANLAVRKLVSSHEDQQIYSKAFAKLPERSVRPNFIFGREAAKQAERIFSKDREYLLETWGIRLSPPDLETVQNGFFINEEEFEEIASVASEFGQQGRRVSDYLRQYVGAYADA